MSNRFKARTLMASLLAIAAMTLGCGDHPLTPSPPEGPTPGAPSASTPTLRVFADAASGFTTSDLRDVDEQIVQINTAGELIWLADGTRLPGYAVHGGYIPAESLCECAFEVRFGTRDGERRAYLTGEYGHHNPGTILDLDLVSGALVVTPSNVYPPGSYTLSGVVTEETSTGRAPIEGVWVSRLVGDGWREIQTDLNGLYEIPGLYDGTSVVSVGKEGYQPQANTASVSGDTRFDILLVRR